MERPIIILFLAANPKDTDKLRLDEEIRSIDQALLKAKNRDMFDLKPQLAVRVTDLQSHFLRYEPDIVHFSGHSSKNNEIILEDQNGESKPVSVRALSELFSVLKNNIRIRCVVLNTCYSEPQAKAIAEHIDCVIGMSKAIGDEAAIQFSEAFYQALGYAQDVKTAFDLGCNQIHLANLNDQDKPRLLAINSNAQEVVFARPSLRFLRQPNDAMEVIKLLVDESMKTVESKKDREITSIFVDLTDLMEELRKTHSTIVKLISPLRRISDDPAIFNKDFKPVYDDFRDFYDAHDFNTERTRCHKISQIRSRMQKRRQPFGTKEQWDRLYSTLEVLSDFDFDIIDQQYKPFMKRFDVIMKNIYQHLQNNETQQALAEKQVFLSGLESEFDKNKAILEEMTDVIGKLTAEF